ncbi:unnamed protein product, partial [Ixodes hexagonus]
GWNDVPWHNPGIRAPNLQRLARGGVILEQNYVQPVCSPTRAALMTGRYPYRFGMQNGVLRPLEPKGLSLDLPFLADELRQRGYSTHAIGKWHLGYCKWGFTPTFRGFDSFRGYYLGAEDYYDHVANGGPNITGYDLRSNTKVDWSASGRYSTVMFGRVQAADHLAPKGARTESPRLGSQPCQCPLENTPPTSEALATDPLSDSCLTFPGMVTAMDDAVGFLEQELVRLGLWNNTVLIFTSDNGGQVLAGGNNWPLRGNKNTLWEGGTRVPAFVASPLLKSPSRTSHSLVHVVDWFPTLVALAGGGPPLSGLDGVDQWKTISECGPSVRQSFVYNLSNRSSLAGAVRWGDFKLVHGFGGRPDGWYPEPLLNKTNVSMSDEKRSASLLLFNLSNDPYERKDLSSQMPDLTARLDGLLLDQAASMVPSVRLPDDPRGDPSRWGGAYSPGWC